MHPYFQRRKGGNAMTNPLKSYIDKNVNIEITGKTFFIGKVVDVGLDIIVLNDGEKYLYIPLVHLHNINEETSEELTISDQESPLDDADTISYRKTLQQAKGKFVEIFVTGNKSIHGYITSVLNDYFVFYSPIYKTLFISLHHLKWLTPYNHNLTPYTLSNEELPVNPSNIPLARTFEEQLKKMEGKLVVFDLGDHFNKSGLLKGISNNIIELVQANGKTIHWKSYHVKTIHLP